jgi:hypothetical protein
VIEYFVQYMCDWIEFKRLGRDDLSFRQFRSIRKIQKSLKLLQRLGRCANIAARRGALGLSRRELSSALGYEDQGRFVERVEYGGQSVPAEYLPAIAKVLQVDDIREFCR